VVGNLVGNDGDGVGRGGMVLQEKMKAMVCHIPVRLLATVALESPWDYSKLQKNPSHVGDWVGAENDGDTEGLFVGITKSLCTLLFVPFLLLSSTNLRSNLAMEV
jgi:hypothetical protein